MSEVISNQQIVDALKQKTLLEVSELVKMIEEAFGVSAAAPVAVAAAPGAGAAQEAAEEKTEFTVILKDAPAAAKIKIIKEVRAITNLGLKEAKDLVEAAPKEILKDVSKDEANDAKKKIEEAGGVIEIK